MPILDDFKIYLSHPSSTGQTLNNNEKENSKKEFNHSCRTKTKQEHCQNMQNKNTCDVVKNEIDSVKHAFRNRNNVDRIEKVIFEIQKKLLQQSNLNSISTELLTKTILSTKKLYDQICSNLVFEKNKQKIQNYVAAVKICIFVLYFNAPPCQVSVYNTNEEGTNNMGSNANSRNCYYITNKWASNNEYCNSKRKTILTPAARLPALYKHFNANGKKLFFEPYVSSQTVYKIKQTSAALKTVIAQMKLSRTYITNKFIITIKKANENDLKKNILTCENKQNTLTKKSQTNSFLYFTAYVLKASAEVVSRIVFGLLIAVLHLIERSLSFNSDLSFFAILEIKAKNISGMPCFVLQLTLLQFQWRMQKFVEERAETAEGGGKTAEGKVNWLFC